MYQIKKSDSHLLVQLNECFDANTVRTIIHHVTMMKEFPCTNDIWLIGKHQAHIRLGELDTLVRDYHHHCPEDSTRTKTAVVAELGLTQAILELWVNAVKKKVPFDIRLFQTLETAEAWLGVRESLVA